MYIGVFYMLSVSVRGGFAYSFSFRKEFYSLPMIYCGEKECVFKCDKTQKG